MKLLRLLGAVLAAVAAVAVAVPVFFIASRLGSMFVAVLVISFVLLLLWFFIARRRDSGAGIASESAFLRQSSKDGLL